MRLPFLQVSQEEMARARTLAGYLSVPYAHALGMTVALKAAALDSAPEGDMSGVITDPNPAEWMAVQCGWPMDRADALATALVRCGFAMAGPSSGYAVASMGPYAKALDTSGKRSEAGRRGAEARKSKGGYGRAMAGPQQIDGQSMARDAKTQTQTQTQTQNRPSDGDSAQAREAPQTPPATSSDAEAFAPPPLAGRESLPDGWSRLFRDIRGSAYLWRVGSDDEQARKLLALAQSGGVDEILRRAKHGLTATYGQRVSTPAELVRKWDANATPEPTGKPKPAAPAGDRPRLDTHAPDRPRL